MDFFAAQERARRLSGWLVALFVLAVTLIVLTVYVVVAIVLLSDEQRLWDPGLFSVTTVGIGLVICGASLVRSAGLRSGGGSAVAAMLGGRMIAPETTVEDERRLMNVVEEMALAAGTPVPVVYVLDGEPAINAFAAGFSPEDAVVAMTRGALDAFTRDEMQAVVAHEFSHIVNRDIRLNIRLTGMLFGILALGLAGRMLLRVSFYGGGRRDGRAIAAMVALGLVLFVAGYLGVLLGRIIRAAVSRQREYLADAAAVQFTRNPDAMAGALKKIGAVGSRLETSSAEEISHFFFANALRSGFVSGLWSTHPPLVERIRRVDPRFDGDFAGVRLERPAEPATVKRRMEGGRGPQALAGVSGLAQGTTPEGSGTRRAPGLDLPARLRHAAHEPFMAVALTYTLILDRDEGARAPQLELLSRHVIQQIHEEVVRLLPAVDELRSDARLALVDLAAPALQLLSDPQAAKLIEVLGALAAADRKLSVFEFAIKTAVRHRLAATHGASSITRFTVLSRVEREVRAVLAMLALAGNPLPEASRAAYAAGTTAVGLDGDDVPPACTSDDVREALDVLSTAATGIRSRVMRACVETALHDRTILPEEAYLLRAIAAALDSPLPDFLPSFYSDEMLADET